LNPERLDQSPDFLLRIPCSDNLQLKIDIIKRSDSSQQCPQPLSPRKARYAHNPKHVIATRLLRSEVKSLNVYTIRDHLNFVLGVTGKRELAQTIAIRNYGTRVSPYLPAFRPQDFVKHGS
jgi:hypothetical protein